MSADNGIYVLKTMAPGPQSDAECQEGSIAPFYEYRVTHAQAIDNLYYDLTVSECKQDFTPEVAYSYFKECQAFYDEGQALSYAHKRADQEDILEYGVCILNHPEQIFQTFTDEEIAAFYRRCEETMAAHRKSRDEEMEAKRNSATVRLAPGDKFHPTRIVGFIVTPDGERVYGQITVKGADEIKVGADFLPNDWNRS